MSELLELQHRIQETSAAISQLERALAADPGSATLRLNLGSVINRFDRLEAEFKTLADRNALDVCRYRLFQPDDRRSPSLRGVTGALYDFQQSISALFDALKNGRRLRVRLGPDVVEATRFDLAYAYPGSVGVVLTMEHERRLFAGDMLDDAIATFFSVARAPSHEDIREVGRRLGPAPLQAIFRWATAHAQGELGADISWHQGPNETERLFLEPQELQRLSDEIAATSEESTERVEASGVLTGAVLGTRRFVFETDEGEPVSGTFTDAIDETHTVTLPKRYKVRLEKATRVQYSSDDIQVTWRLLAIDEI